LADVLCVSVVLLLARRVEEVAGADDTGRVAAGAEGGGESGCGSAGAMPRSDDPWRDEFGEVAHRRFDAVLDGCAGEVVAAEQEIDRLVR
jgi:hypothetical protein